MRRGDGNFRVLMMRAAWARARPARPESETSPTGSLQKTSLRDDPRCTVLPEEAQALPSWASQMAPTGREARALVDPYSFPPGGRWSKSRPPYKPCMRISRTRLTSSHSAHSITRPPSGWIAPDSGQSHGVGTGPDGRSSRDPSGRLVWVSGGDPYGPPAALSAASKHMCRAD